MRKIETGNACISCVMHILHDPRESRDHSSFFILQVIREVTKFNEAIFHSSLIRGMHLNVWISFMVEFIRLINAVNVKNY